MADATKTKSPAVIEIERLGFTYEEVSQYDLTRLSVDRRVQVREASHYAPRETVEQYAIQMGHVAFPPIVVTTDGWIVDGNTRIGAALRRKEKFFPALVLAIAWQGASDKRQNELHALAATLNAQGGVRLTRKETREVAARFIALGWKTDQIARALGVAGPSVSGIKKEISAAERLQRVGVSKNGSLPGASLRALGSQPVLDLNDIPYRDLAKLAVDAGLNVSEITGLAKDAKATGSDQGAIDTIGNQRVELEDRIREHELTGVAKPPVARQLRQHLGFVTKFDGREHELVETNPDVFSTHIETLERSIAVLTTVLGMQR